MIELNVFDFDKTIYDGDSSIDIYVYLIKKKPQIIRYLPVQLFGMLMYKFKLKPKEYFKEKYFSFLKGIKNIDELIEEFWSKNNSKIKYDLLKDKENIVVISASPEFLLEPICNILKVQKLIASKVEKKTGKFLGKNCYGKEKVNRLNNEYDSYIIKEFYSDSLSDSFLADKAEKSYLVSKNEIKKWK